MSHRWCYQWWFSLEWTNPVFLETNLGNNTSRAVTRVCISLWSPGGTHGLHRRLASRAVLISLFMWFWMNSYASDFHLVWFLQLDHSQTLLPAMSLIPLHVWSCFIASSGWVLWRLSALAHIHLQSLLGPFLLFCSVQTQLLCLAPCLIPTSQ